MVTDEHRAFARAVVALARQHAMTGIDLRFRCSHPLPGMAPRCWEQVEMQWSEGRHGDAGQIIMRTEAREDIPERAPTAEAVS